VAAARAALDRSRGLPGIEGMWLKLAQLDLEGRLALAENKPAVALAAFTRLASLAPKGTPHLEARWSALTGLGETQLALSRTDAARDAFAAAEGLLDDAALLVPTGEGRGVLVAGYERSARGLVESLVRLGREREALDAVRAARARVARALVTVAEIAAMGPERRAQWESTVAAYRRARAELEAQAAQDWTLPAKELEAQRAARAARETELRKSLDEAMSLLARGRPTQLRPLSLAEGTVAVTWHPGTKAAWAFTATAGPAGEVVRARETRLPTQGASASDLADALLSPVHDELAAARRVRIVAAGPLSAYDIHALPLDGSPLGTKVPVEWSLDLPGAAPARPPTATLRVVIASDPDGNLAAARVEAEDVARIAREQWRAEVVRLHQTAVTASAVVEALSSASIFHFAGHARTGGSWDAALSLTGGERLTVADLVASPSAPSLVVLTACEAARSVPGAEALGLAQAFVVAGAEWTTAPSRPIADAVAGNFGRAFHRALSPGAGTLEVPEAYRRALGELSSSNDGADWAAFRLFTR
jgi:CHAT domain-containing protein